MPPRQRRTVTPAIAGALVVLAASFALSVAFVLANGGLDLPAAERSAGSSQADAGPAALPSAAALASGASASGAPASGSPADAPYPQPSGAPSASAAAAPGSAAPTALPTPGPTSGPTPRPSSNRYDLLTACPATPDCWVYVVRQGDNLFSIARYFGVSLEVVQDRNPWTRTESLVAGRELLLPTPTR